jgi:imidazolonepropionase-like amidohydrolase
MTAFLRRLVLFVALVPACHAMAQDRRAIVGDSIVLPSGELAAGQAVIVAGGRIEKVVPEAQIPQGTPIDRYPGAVISPGLIDVLSEAGAYGAHREAQRAIDPAASVIDAIDPLVPALVDLLRRGITAVMVVPDDNNVVGGVCATIRTYVPDARLDVIRADGPLILSLGPAVLTVDREPTSRAGALSMLREALALAKANKGDERLARAIQGKLDVVVRCEAAEDVDGLLRVLGEVSIKPRLAHAADLVEVAGDLEGSTPLVIAGPLGLASSPRLLQGPAAAAEADLGVALTGGTPRRDGLSLRLGAALAVRYGLAPDAARAAITSAPATAAGVADRIGRLVPGLDADLAIFSGDPLRLDSRVIAVYVGGQRVFSEMQIIPDESVPSGGDYADQ